MNLRIVVEGLTAVQLQLEEMARRGMNMRPVMGVIGHIMQQSIMKNFEHQGRPGWKRLSSFTQMIYEGQAIDKARSTKAWQKAGAKGKQGIENRKIARDVSGGKILQRSGDLKKSITVGNVTNSSVEVGSPLVYARIHQIGGTVRPKRFDALYIPTSRGYIRKMQSVIPARPYLMLQNEDQTFILRAVQAYMIGGDQA
ncbi:phage virion morphogenesis protein [Aneurinibacillus sp. Ricciae_BoGa-3]|uniref:phage virion morphogenesis protein n=1 Tax=Aneurinibacillus sp. Ricciae_BoGa-3 TaxID=3022697 RepID=UPI002341E9BF|nr:phage virion morphogenesis protein [Aneurinibacillus sp. Ricciae_BoGa-3]WCK53841.1 phage virion morphogenesis protein [Aneurinibacillus sp. Ricciae_BoGa-3]